MADNILDIQNTAGPGTFKEAVCINASRIYDSCSDKDCLEDLRVYFTDVGQQVIDAAYSVKARDITVLNVYLDVEAVPFNKGFYSVDLTYYFKVNLDAYVSSVARPTAVEGLAVFCKKVILYGSEGNVKTFNSETQMTVSEADTLELSNLPKASVQVAQPIALSVDVLNCAKDKCVNALVAVPESIADLFAGDFTTVECPDKIVVITLGVFSIVSLERTVQLMIPCYDFCVPDKECPTTTDNPCDLFKKIKFPFDDFFPPRLEDISDGDQGDCGCK